MYNYLTKHTQRAKVALQTLSEKDPGYGTLILYCKHRDAPEDIVVHGAPRGENGQVLTACAWTDGEYCMYAPGFEKYDKEQQMAIVAHEVSHVVLRHIPRSKKLLQHLGSRYSNYIFNVAADAIINEMLRACRFKIPQKSIFLTDVLKQLFGIDVTAAECLSVWDVERLYHAIVKKVEENLGPNGCISQIGSGMSNGEYIVVDFDQLPSELQELIKKAEFEPDFFPNQGHEEDSDMQDLIWSQRFSAAVDASKEANKNRSKDYGFGLGMLGYRLADLPKPLILWHREMRDGAMKALVRKPRINYGRPTNRFLALDDLARTTGRSEPGYEPSILRRHKVQRAVVGMDVSGSVSQKMIKRFAGEISGISRRTGAEIWVIVFDDGVHSITKLRHGHVEADLMNIKFGQGGGTNFIQPIAEAIKLDPSVIIMLTDMYGPFPESANNIPVIWTVPNNMAPPKAPFGRVISVSV